MCGRADGAVVSAGVDRCREDVPGDGDGVELGRFGERNLGGDGCRDLDGADVGAAVFAGEFE